jgi:hypothetical protein
MEWISFGIAGAIILLIIWFGIKYKLDLRKDKKIFDEYLENQRNTKFSKRSGISNSKKEKQLFDRKSNN